MALDCSSSIRTRHAIQIDRLILVDHQTYILEPPLMKTTRRLWYSGAFIPYSIADNIFAFMGPLPRLVKKPDFLEKILPSYHGWKHMVFSDQPFDFNFLENNVYLPPPLEAPNSSYINWLNRMEKRRKALWKYLGIFDLIQLSRVHLKYNPTMLLSSMCFLESTTNTFHLPCGMLTPTLFDLAVIAALRPTKEAYESS